VGFAQLQMQKELAFSETVYGFGAGIFFLGYVLFEVPSNIILHKVGAQLWLARVMVTWAIISAVTAFVSTPTTFYVMRFLLGVAEAGFIPGVLLYLTFWFPASRRGRITALFLTAIPMASIFGGPLSGWILSAAAGASTSQASFWTLPASFLGGAAAAAGIALVNCLGNIAGFASTYVVGWMADLTHSNVTSLYLFAGIVSLGAILVLMIPASLVNR
jgi:MFS family permease